MDPIPTQGKRKDAMMDDEGFVSTSLPKRLRQEYGSLPDSRPGQFAVMNDSGDSQRVVLEDLNTSDSLKTLVAGVDASEIILPECSSAGSTTSGNPNIDGNVQLDNSDIGIFAGEDHGPHVDDINKPSRSLIINQGLTAYRLLQLSGKAPPVWAKTRAGLCSSVPYFRQHEGGNYHTKDIPGPKNPSFTRGLLLDAGVSARDYIDGTVIITTM